jgi:hypothetical protein
LEQQLLLYGMFLIPMVLVLVTAATDQMNITVNTCNSCQCWCADQTTCGASPITLAANATTGGNWTGGAGYLLRIEILLMQLILLQSEKLEQQLLLSWNVPDPDGAGPCTAATDQMNITINNATVANAGADQTTCGASPITLAANANYRW